MAEIRRYPFVSHLRSEPTSYVLRYRKGARVAGGRGLSFWFRPLHTALVEVPVDDRELQFHFHGRSADFQDVSVQGAVTFRVAEPETLATRIDFTIDTRRGTYRRTPLEQLAGLLTQTAQNFVWGYLVATPLATLLTVGVEEIGRRLREGFSADARLAEMGVTVSAVTVLAVQPAPEVERALQTPELESIQQRADKATFERRASAVQQERAIAENELANRIELARREEALVAQEGLNERRRAEEEAARTEIGAAAEAKRIESVERARNAAERERLAAHRDVPAPVLQALALREAAGKLRRIDHLAISPDALTPVLARLAGSAGERRDR